MHQNASLCRISNKAIMRKDYEKLFSHLTPPEPPTGLFDRIIFAIKREQELQRTKRLAFGFLVLLVISLSAAPFSVTLLAEQVANSGILYFIETAFNNFGNFPTIWQNFALAIAESLPVVGITLFAVNMIIAVFTLRLFLHRKRLLLGYFMNGMNFS